MVYKSIYRFGIHIIILVMYMNLRIKEMREDRDIKQSELAELLKCSQVCYSRYENGQREIPLEALCILAEFYNTTTDYLLGLTDNPENK